MAPATAPTGPAATPAANPAAAPPNAAPTPASMGWAPAASVLGSGFLGPRGGRSGFFSLGIVVAICLPSCCSSGEREPPKPMHFPCHDIRLSFRPDNPRAWVLRDDVDQIMEGKWENSF